MCLVQHISCICRTNQLFHSTICFEFDTCFFLSNEIWFICHTGIIRYTETLCFVDLVYFQVLLHWVIGSTSTDFARLEIQIFENMQKDTCLKINIRKFSAVEFSVRLYIVVFLMKNGSQTHIRNSCKKLTMLMLSRKLSIERKTYGSVHLFFVNFY
jgi:hypothetical protein